jgi:hypothetical protein
MGIQYTRPSRKPSGVNDGFSEVLRGAYEEFKAQDINVFGEGFADVLKEDSFYQKYTEQLSQLLSNDDAENFKIMCDNNRDVALEAASLGSVAPMSYLQNPMLRKCWAKLAMPRALPTQAVEEPKFTITYLQPWIRNAEGRKLFVPEDLAEFGDAVSKVRLSEDAPIYLTVNGLAAGAVTGAANVNLLTGYMLDETSAPTASKYYIAGSVKTAASIARVKSNDEMDRDITILQVGFVVPTTSDTVIYNGATHAIAVTLRAPGSSVAFTAADLLAQVHIQMATRNNSFKELVRLELDVDASCVGGTAGETARVALVDTLFAECDLQSGRFTVTSVAKRILRLDLRAFVSAVMNNSATDVNFDVIDKEVHVGTAPHVSASVPNEYITDLLKMYSFSGVTKVVDIISNTLAQKLDLDGIDFIDTAIEDYLNLTNSQYLRKFSAKPVGNTMIAPSEWRKEIRIVIDHLAQDLINRSHFEVGYFVLLGNPIDTNLVPDVTWSFNGGGREMAGVPVQYALGNFQGAFSYNLVSSPNVPQGHIRLYFIPTSEDQMTYKFFPYSFTVEQPGNGYLNPNAQNVPGIIAHRRYSFEKILQCAGKVVVTNNTYSEYSFAGTSSYLPTSTEV